MDLHLSIKGDIHRFYGVVCCDRYYRFYAYYHQSQCNRKTGAGRESCSDLLCSHEYFPFAGDALLQLFNADISSFAIAGALVLLVLAVEMIFSVEIFRNDGPAGSVTIVPVVFPLIAGAGTLTTTLFLCGQNVISPT